MIKKLLIVVAVLSSMVFSSCETDFDVTADWKDITIVYGLLNQNDSVHYVKINKAFLGDGDLTQYAQISDSTTYNNTLIVKLQEYSNSNLLIREIPLDTTTIYNKEEGVFNYPEQIVYTTGLSNKVFLNENNTYKLFIQNPVTGKEVTSETGLIHDFALNKPQLNHPTYPTITFPNNHSYKYVEWYSAENGKRYQLQIFFKYLEKEKNSNEVIEKTVVWDDFATKRSENADGGQLQKIKFLNERFFTFVNDKVPYSDTEKENNIDYREAISVNFVITVASNEFDTYMELYKPSNSIVQSNPDYTNIVNGKGLFASRYTKNRIFGVHPNTQEQLSFLGLHFRMTQQ